MCEVAPNASRCRSPPGPVWQRETGIDEHPAYALIASAYVRAVVVCTRGAGQCVSSPLRSGDPGPVQVPAISTVGSDGWVAPPSTFSVDQRRASADGPQHCQASM